jgi:hypothetical protein
LIEKTKPPVLPVRIYRALRFPSRIRARARFNNAKEAEKHADNQELEPRGSPKERNEGGKTVPRMKAIGP